MEAGAALPDVALCVCVSYGTPRSQPRLFGVPVCREDTQALGEGWGQHPPAEKRGAGCCPASFCVWQHRTSRRGLQIPVGPNLSLVQQQSPLPVDEAGNPSQSRDPLRGFLGNGFDMAVRL